MSGQRYSRETINEARQVRRSTGYEEAKVTKMGRFNGTGNQRTQVMRQWRKI